MIKIDKILKKFNEIIAIDNISFKLNIDDIVAFIETNGLRKSTTMKITSGYIYTSSRSIKIFDKYFIENQKFFKKYICYIPERYPLYYDITVINFLYFIAKNRNMNRNKFLIRLNCILDILNINSFFNKKIGRFLKRFKRRVGLAQSIIRYAKNIKQLYFK